MRFMLPLAAASALLAPAAAQAHSQLVTGNPAPGAVVRTAPGTLQLTFNEPVIARFVTLAVTGPDGAALHVATITVDPKNRARVSAPVHGGGKPGVYRVNWTAAGSDMHRLSGSYSFTVRP
jgi:methionine-rich copper-binding protein CopC